jgi:hypothetical protein
MYWRSLCPNATNSPSHSLGPPITVAKAMEMLCERGFYGAPDPVEGAVWRVERKGKVDFLGKFVRPDKKDGCCLPEIGGG